MTANRSAQDIVQRNYLMGAIVCALAYVGLTLGAKLAIRALDPQGAALIALAVTPALAIVAYVFVFARYLAGVDEYRRHRMVQSLLIAVAVIFSASAVWDFLQAYGQAPAPEPFVFTCGFMLTFGFAQGGMGLIEKLGRRA